MHLCDDLKYMPEPRKSSSISQWVAFPVRHLADRAIPIRSAADGFRILLQLSAICEAP
jgi:hypothetical protein